MTHTQKCVIAVIVFLALVAIGTVQGHFFPETIIFMD